MTIENFEKLCRELVAEGKAYEDDNIIICPPNVDFVDYSKTCDCEWWDFDCYSCYMYAFMTNPHYGEYWKIYLKNMRERVWWNDDFFDDLDIIEKKYLSKNRS